MGWGSNAFGQLNQPAGVGQLRDITLGLRHTSALRTDGTVVCWGHDGFNQVGALPAGLSSVVAIHAGDNHTIALRADGTVVCWGDNIFEQCDVPVSLAPAVGVSAGEQMSGALHADGTVTLWGWDSADGRLNVPADLGSVTKLELGMTFGTVLRTDGTTRYWGNFAPRIDASAVLRDLAAGLGHVLGLRPDGTVQAWGANVSGQSTVPAGLTNVAAVAAGRLHSLALKQDGSVVCWGSNARGQAPNPSPVTANGRQVAAGEEFSYGLTLAGGIAAPSIVVASATDPVCGLNNGAIDTTVANADFVFWTGPSGYFRNGADLTGLAAGAYTVTAVGKGGSVSQVVTLTAQSDTTAPVVTSYDASESIAAGLGCTAVVPDFTASVVAGDNCTDAAALVITQLPAAGTALGLGAHDITITVTDGSDNEATVTAVFTVTGTAVNYYVDADGDTFGAGAAVVYCNTATHPGYVTNNGDCDDTRLLYADNDSDTFGADSPVACGVASNTDCNDADGAINPVATEVCDAANTDENCNGSADDADAGVDAASKSDFYRDADADGYTVNAATRFCDLPVGYEASPEGDCNDASGAIYPGAVENCANDGTDNDCDGINTEAEADDRSTFYRDADADTFTGSETALFCNAPAGYEPTNEGDCNDANNAVYPGAVENCANDGTDNDCDGDMSADEAADSVNYYVDGDQDGFGAGAATKSCAPIAGSVTDNTDCNDASNAIYPGAPELCSNLGTDNDCDGINTEAEADDRSTFYRDADGDGFTGSVTALFCTAPAGYEPTNEGDCNDTDSATYPGAVENCANILVDNDCDGDMSADEAIDSVNYYVDGDQDGFGAGVATKSCTQIAGSVTNNADCDDARLLYADNDGDTSGAGAPVACGVPTNTDCNDGNASVNPNAVEDCANLAVDNDCDGSTADAEAIDATSYYADVDQDGFGAGAATKSCTPIQGSVTNNADCQPTQVTYNDGDLDGFGAGAMTACGNTTNDADCNDGDASVNPKAVENCANLAVDNDCDGSTAEDEAIDRDIFYSDLDEDGAGDPASPTIAACAAPSGYVANADDGCPSDAAKVAPGACGCGQPDTDSNGDGIADCNSLVVRLTPERVSVQPGTQFTLRVSSVTTLRSVAYQLGMHFDPSRLTLTAVTPAPGTPFDVQLYAAIDNAAGTVVYAAGVVSLDGFVAGGASLFDLHFTASAATGCDLAGSITFGNVGSIESLFAIEGGMTLAPITEGLAAFSIDGTPPMITGAGMTSGALADCTAPVPDFRHLPVDGCSTANELVITQNPAPGTAAGLGVTDVTVVATDAAGNTNFAVLPFTVTGDPVVYYMDGDGDGFGDDAVTETNCIGSAPVGFVASGNDCDDSSAGVYPGALETCANLAVDNDCDGSTAADEAFDRLTLYADADADGYGNAAVTQLACSAPAGYVADSTDCDDSRAAVHALASFFIDADFDGFGWPTTAELCEFAPPPGYSSVSTDCNDDNAAINPGAPEQCNDIDDNCNTTIDDGITTQDWYPDTDGDGYGDASAQAVPDCRAPAGHVPNNDDCNDATGSISPDAAELCSDLGIDNDCDGINTEAEADDRSIFYRDTDGDGFTGSVPALFCTAPAGYEPTNEGDCNDNAAAVNPGAPELCGDALDNDCDGQLNEGCTVFTLRLASDAPSVSAGGTFTVRASCTAPAAALSGAQITLHFDATRLRLEAVDPVGGNPLELELVEQIDNGAGTLRYALGLLYPDSGLTEAADLCDLTFRVLPSASLCGAADLVGFGQVGAFTTRFTRLADAAPIVPALTNLPSINLDSVPPVLAGVPADISVATDAGSTFGALVSLPTVTATDDCDGSVAVTATGIPSGGLFPIGTTTVTWTATDAAGNTATSSRTVTVGDYQLLDAVVSFSSPQLGASRHALRIGAGAAVQVVDTLIPAWSGATPTTPTSATVTVHVPVASSYPCVSVKSVGATVAGGAVRASHTLTDTASASVSGSRYRAEFVLLSGDSNDDDMVEILDYGNWLVDRSAPGNTVRAPEARSNYNGDGLVIQGDVGLVVAYFFRVGESCTPGADAPRHPRDRIHVKELRRMGRGELAAADLNHDGWVDTRDMQMALQGGGGAQPRPEHDLRVEW